ncbi:putative mitochondrial protein AtMg00310 [Castanea sativa]|uniref:putative mitochondrial protein AtMg00310 n=1 Tax=Castanea sativa TaxID=21020 RepID=UPI003F64B3B8
MERKFIVPGRGDILIKVVVQAIPTYMMLCFKLLKGLINEIEGLIRKFGWGYRREQKRIHWVSWEKLCLPKSEGGMGFRELSRFDDSLLAKQVWRLKKNEDTLFHKVFKANFFPSCSIMEANSLSKGSYAWKTITQAKRVVELGLVWQVGDGKSIKVRGDKWLPSSHGSCIVSPASSLSPDSNVSALIDEESHTWNTDLI